IVDVPAAKREAVRRRVRRAQAVRDGSDSLDRFRPSAGKASVHRVGAFRLHAMHGAAREDLLHRARDTGAQAAAADGNDYRVELSRLFANLEAQRGGAKRRERSLEGVDESTSLLLLDLAHARERRMHVVDEL